MNSSEKRIVNAGKRILNAGGVLLALLLCANVCLADSSKGKKKKIERKSQVAAQAEAQPTPVAIEPPQPQPARPANGSLFTDDAAATNLLADFKARRVGDLVFVDVIEDSTATVASNAKRGRDSGTLGGIVAAAGALPVPGAAIAAGVAGGLGSRKFEGNGATSRNSNMRARIAARVVAVLPNGDLQIEAEKLVKINREDERLALSGIVRQRDLAADNSVPTTSIGELRVDLNGKGVASADNGPGWLFRLFEKITPF